MLRLTHLFLLACALALVCTPATAGGDSADAFVIERETTQRYCNAWLFEPIARLDAPLRVEVVSRDLEGTECLDFEDWSSDEPSLLFEDFDTSTLHPSYQATCDLCDKLDLAQDTDDYAAIEEDIRFYLAGMAELPTLRYALAVTDTSVEDLYNTWFGPGQGFEHAMCGEKDPDNPTNTGGYHFWYRFYQEERREGDGHVNWRCALEGIEDPAIATFRFEWNPLGRDDYRRKPIGGFTVGNSPAAMLALGHIALWRGCDASADGNDIIADINGTPYEWVVVTKQGSLLTLYPKALDHTLPVPAQY